MQVDCPSRMVQESAIRDPEGAAVAAHTLPFQLVPLAQVAVTVTGPLNKVAPSDSENVVCGYATHTVRGVP